MPKVLDHSKRSESWADHKMLMHELEKSYRIDRQLRNVCRFIWVLCLVVTLFMFNQIGNEGHVDGGTVLALMFYLGAAFVMRLLDKFYSKTMLRRF